jgi:hypothetical protein
MASNLTNQVRSIALVTTAVANGDLSQKITVEAKGEVLELKSTINTDGRSAIRVRGGSDRAWLAKWARREYSAARRTCLELRARGRT